jgi:hypothetical protein
MRRRSTSTIVLAAVLALGACGGPDGMGAPPVVDVPQGPPAEPPVLTVAPICLGVPFATCQDMARSAAEIPPDAGPGRAIGRITVRCIGLCTPRKGEGETRVDYLDGSSMTSSWGYESSGG